MSDRSVDAPERAVLYVPIGEESERWQRIDLDYCDAMGYRFVAVVLADPDDPERWREVHGMASRDELDVLVVARRDHLSARRRPRIEVVAEMPARGRERPHDHPRIIR